MEATVKSCVYLKDWSANGRSGKVYTVTLSDNTTGQSFSEIPTGTPVSEIEISEGQYGKRFKWAKPKGGFQAKRVGNESFALAYSKDWAIAQLEHGREVKTDDILKIADKFFDWLEGKKK